MTGGKGFSIRSQLNAFGMALVEANIAQANLVVCTSVLTKEISFRDSLDSILPGQIVHIIPAKMTRKQDQLITAGIGIAFTDE